MVDVRRGFTLIELLIVISIIALLSLIGLVAYSEFLKTARDNRRQSDLKLIQSALEDYHADQLYYPDGVPPDRVCSSDGFLELFCPLKSPNGQRVYLSEIPNDPKDFPPYCYEAVGCVGSSPPKCSSYNLSTSLEGSTATKFFGCGFANTYNLQVTRP